LRPEKALDPVLGLAAILPIDDVKTLKDLRDKLVEMAEKPRK
jgi:hypothetical protein